jgi:LacI family fructose operon transcriptional repressor
VASIKDVARLADVSTTTVSRFLSDPASVRGPLRERVQQAVIDLAYRPNLAARRLRQRRASLIGLIVSDIRDRFFTDISRAVEDVAYRHGLRLILGNSDHDPAKERAYLQLMADEQASGVILSPTLQQLQSFRPEQAGFPVVMIDRALSPAPTDVVLPDNLGAAQRLTRHVLDQGHRQVVALVAQDSRCGRERLSGFVEAMHAAGQVPHVLTLPPAAAPAQAAVKQLFCAPGAGPDAIIAMHGQLMLGALQAIQSTGLRMPGDIALAGFDQTEWTVLPPACVTVMALPAYDKGRTAAELLLQRIADGSRRPRRVVLDSELLVRGSTGGHAPPQPTVHSPALPMR